MHRLITFADLWTQWRRWFRGSIGESLAFDCSLCGVFKCIFFQRSSPTSTLHGEGRTSEEVTKLQKHYYFVIRPMHFACRNLMLKLFHIFQVFLTPSWTCTLADLTLYIPVPQVWVGPMPISLDYGKGSKVLLEQTKQVKRKWFHLKE